MRKTTPPATTLKPDPVYSLFKYVFEYNHNKGGTDGYPRKMYSMDYVSERKLFPDVIQPSIKAPYRAFIEEMKEHEIIYGFYANCVPTLKLKDEKEIICLRYNTHDEMDRIRKLIQANKALQASVANLARKHGVLWAEVESIPIDKEDITLCPKYYPNQKRNNLNGLKGCIAYWTRTLKDKGLTRIKVFDNRCIHTDNLITEFTIPENQTVRNG